MIERETTPGALAQLAATMRAVQRTSPTMTRIVADLQRGMRHAVTIFARLAPIHRFDADGWKVYTPPPMQVEVTEDTH